jgi:porphobilinogen synthase
MLRRPRRNRRTAAIRGMIRETHLSVENLVQPLFLVEGMNIRQEVKSLPGNYRLCLNEALKEIENCLKLGIHNFILFPAIPERYKDKVATYSYREDNFYLQYVREIRYRFPEICLISDVAMDPYSTDGHDGLLHNGKILNDETLPILTRMALMQADAGFDLLGPSDMMDGRVGAMRQALDDAGFTDTGIMSYTAKYASAFYGPFRDALDSAPKAGDKKTYQMDPANQREALIEAELDIQEGADFIMVKPALNYLDIISLLKNNTETPVAAYHVSGECAMLLAAAEKGYLDLDRAVEETLTCIRRAGSDVLITYFAKHYAQLAQKQALQSQKQQPVREPALRQRSNILKP